MKPNIRNPIFVTSSLLAVLVFVSFPAQAGDVEEPAFLQASGVLSDRLRKGEYHRVDENVRSDGFLNYYVLRSDYGDWEVTSTPLLALRVREVEALATLDDLSRTEVFIKAAADAGIGQLKAIKEFATHPIETITGIPKGIGRLFTRYKRDAEEAVDVAEDFLDGDDDDEDNGAEQDDDDSNVGYLILRYCSWHRVIQSGRR